MKTLLLSLYLSAAVFIILFSDLSAQIAIIDEGASPIITDSSVNALVGYSFVTASSPLSVFSLGLWDDGADGFEDAHDIFLEGSFGSVSLEIPAGTVASLIGNFRYMNLTTPILLPPSTTYTIWVGGFSGSNDSFRSSTGTGPIFADDIFSAISFYQHDLGGFPFTLVGGAPHVGPNFQYTVVPEPDSTQLMFLALILLSMKVFFARHKIHA
jgi:hypothetical protein